jgi:hypothetical protein
MVQWTGMAKRLLTFNFSPYICKHNLSFFIGLVERWINGTNYKSDALKYIKDYDSTQTYKYTGMSKKDSNMYTGCIVEVYLRGNLSHEETTVLFRMVKLYPWRMQFLK